MRLTSFENYKFYPSREPSQGLILALHGRGDSAHGLSFLRHHLRIDNRDWLFLNAPDPWPLPYGAPGYSWYGLAPDHRPGIERSLQKLNDALAELASQGYARNQIVLFGFSQGCLMSLELGLRSPQPFEGIVGISGVIYDQKKLLEEMHPNSLSTPVWMSHGYQDDVLPYEGFVKLRDKLSSKLLNYHSESLSKSHTIISVEFDLIAEFLLRIQREKNFFKDPDHI